MGLNLNLVSMLGMPTKAVCPHCEQINELYFDGFDVEGVKTPKGGVFTLGKECHTCEKNFTVVCKFEPPTIFIKKA
jgi:hypothetical protein